jgi:hypothetical protein
MEIKKYISDILGYDGEWGIGICDICDAENTPVQIMKNTGWIVGAASCKKCNDECQTTYVKKYGTKKWVKGNCACCERNNVDVEILKIKREKEILEILVCKECR